jgi:hypothetical protein
MFRSAQRSNLRHVDPVALSGHLFAEPLDPLLGPLEMNGGFTPAQALLPGSPAIDQGNSFGIHTDQRGQRRPDHHIPKNKSDGGDGSDIGAFEVQDLSGR